MARKPRPLTLPHLKLSTAPALDFEKRYRDLGMERIAGVDEAGRGPLAGPVVAAAVVLPERIGKSSPLWTIRDSKTLSREKREAMYEIIAAGACDLGWAFCDPLEIDRMNILAASLEAMRRAVMHLEPAPGLCLVDGNHRLPCAIPSVPVVKGDRICLSITAASIMAKVIRDQIMTGLDKRYPLYGFASHKGYATAGHKRAILEKGPCPAHRKTFRGVRDCLRAYKDL